MPASSYVTGDLSFSYFTRPPHLVSSYTLTHTHIPHNSHIHPSFILTASSILTYSHTYILYFLFFFATGRSDLAGSNNEPTRLSSLIGWLLISVSDHLPSVKVGPEITGMALVHKGEAEGLYNHLR